MREVLYIPVVHTDSEMGSLSDAIAQSCRERLGAEGWEQRNRTVQEVWDEIENQIDSLRIDLHKVKIYVDALPVCGQEARIVQHLAATGSRNHQLIARLVQAGATLMGTEDVQLLLREYDLAKTELDAMKRPGGPDTTAGREQAAAVKDLRDRFVAQRIGETLSDGETGIVFMGLLHDVPRHLEAGIRLRFLPHGLPFGAQLESGVR